MNQNTSHQSSHHFQAQTTSININNNQQQQVQTTNHLQDNTTNHNNHDHHHCSPNTTEVASETNSTDFSTKSSSNFNDPSGFIKSGKDIIAGVINTLVELNVSYFEKLIEPFLLGTFPQSQIQITLLKFNHDDYFTEHSTADDSQSPGNFTFNKVGVFFPFHYWFQRRKVVFADSLEVVFARRSTLGFYYLIWIIPMTYYWELFPPSAWLVAVFHVFTLVNY